jgi:hypothetical protein
MNFISHYGKTVLFHAAFGGISQLPLAVISLLLALCADIFIIKAHW